MNDVQIMSVINQKNVYFTQSPNTTSQYMAQLIYCDESQYYNWITIKTEPDGCRFCLFAMYQCYAMLRSLFKFRFVKHWPV